MPPRINKQKAIEVIMVELEKGSTYSLCLDVIRRKWSLSESTFKRYWKVANVSYQEQQESIKKELESNATQKAIARQNKAILNKEERMEIASKIARGKAWTVSKESIIPTANDRLKALDYLSKVEGDYAPVKQDLTTKGKELQPARFLTKKELKDLYRSFEDDY